MSFLRNYQHKRKKTNFLHFHTLPRFYRVGRRMVSELKIHNKMVKFATGMPRVENEYMQLAKWTMHYNLGLVHTLCEHIISTTPVRLNLMKIMQKHKDARKSLTSSNWFVFKK